jgi:ACS family hexuronate transporter-like MFS transporter
MNKSGQDSGIRWMVVVLLFFATTINYIDRQVIGLLKPVLEVDLQWSETDYSRIVMAFTASYAIGLLIFGRIIDYIGSKAGYIVSVIFWSLAACAHALARTTFGFGVARAALGIGEAGNFPAAIKALTEWFPKKERAFATGLFNSGANIGALVAPIMVPVILSNWGWQAAFIITGALGFIWVIFWQRFYTLPQKNKKVNQSELEHINSDPEESESNQIKPDWITLFRYRQTWTFIAGKLFTDPIWYFFLFWLPAYFSSSFNLDLKKPGWELVVVYTLTSVGSIGGGYLSTYLIKKGMPLFQARKITMLIIACAVLPIITARYAESIWVAVLLISIAAAAHQAWSANILTSAADMFPKNSVSSVIGIGSMAGSVGGIFFPMFIGSVLDHYKLLGNITAGYNLIFLICGFAYLIAWVIMHFLTPRMEPVEFKR